MIKKLNLYDYDYNVMRELVLWETARKEYFKQWKSSKNPIIKEKMET